jgi:hypothetical protein
LQVIELTFHTDEGPITIQIDAPVARPEDPRWPWQVEVRLNGRPTTLVVGEDPFEALWHAGTFAAAYLHGREGLDPKVNDPRGSTAPAAPPSPDPRGSGTPA